VQGKPSDRLVRIAFGVEHFSKRAGLYVVSQAGTESVLEEMVAFMPLISNADAVQAGMFMFYGIMLMIYLEEEGPDPEALRGSSFNGVSLGKALITQHEPQYKVMVGKYLSHKLVYHW
jgi:hypothetical protein